jgi:hypothetical protein
MRYPPAEAGGLGLATDGETVVVTGDQGRRRGPGKAIGRGAGGRVGLASASGEGVDGWPRPSSREASGTGISGTVASGRRVIGTTVGSAGSAG